MRPWRWIVAVFVTFCVGTLYGTATVSFRFPPYPQLVGMVRSVYASPAAEETFYQAQLTQFRAHPTSADTVMVGDSLTAMGHWDELLPDLSLVNRAIAGDTGADILERLDTIQSTHAKRAILMFGVNDVRSPANDDQIFANYVKIISALQPMRVVVQSTFPTSHQRLNQRIDKLNRRLKIYCTTTNTCSFIDTAKAVTVAGSLNPEFSIDGVHINGRGYVAWAKSLKEHLS